MVTNGLTEIADLPGFFKGVSREERTVRPFLISARKGRQRGFHLILEGSDGRVTVADRGQPALFGDLRDIIPILTDAYTLEVMGDELQVNLAGYF